MAMTTKVQADIRRHSPCTHNSTP